MLNINGGSRRDRRPLEGFAPMTTETDISKDRLSGAQPDGMPANFAPTPLPVVSRRNAQAMPCGIALAFATDECGNVYEDRFALRVVDGEGEVLMQIASLAEEEVVAQWRDCAQKSGLPRMIVREDGSVVPVARQLGRIALGTSRQRRRHGLLNGRRPRFLVRRKTSRLPARPRIYRGENEIIARS